MNTIEFNYLSQHSLEAQHLVPIVTLSNFEIVDLREAEIIDSVTKKPIGMKVLVWQCKGDLDKFEKLKERNNLTEIRYEGRRTLGYFEN